MCAMAQNNTPAGTDASPLALYQRPMRAACSSLFHHDEEIRTKPGLRQDSKTPKKNRAGARVAKLLALPVAASVIPLRNCQLRLYSWILDGKPTPQNEVNSQVFASREPLHEVVGRILGNLVLRAGVSLGT
jgi:hypothetical protein